MDTDTQNTQARLLGYMAAYSRKYPRAWEIAEDMRAHRSELPQWPAWCYLPLSGWWSVISAHKGGANLELADAADFAVLAALGAWRYTQGIYQYHTAVLDALADTPLGGDMPMDVLHRLPEWCVYVDLPHTPQALGGIRGFFAFLDFDPKDERHELRFVLDSGTALWLGPIVHIGPWSVVEGVERMEREAQRLDPSIEAGNLDDYADLAARLMSVMLYLCADEPELLGHEPGQRPNYPQYKRVKGGDRLFPPVRPHVWRVGEVIGAELGRATDAAPAAPGERHTPRPHMRRAHWHGYWTGPRKPRQDNDQQQPRRFGFKWLPPMAIGLGKDNDNE